MHITVQTARTNPSVKKKNIKGIFGIERATKQFRSEARLIRVLSYQGWRLATRVFPEKGADRSPIRSPFPLFSVSAIRNLHSTAPQSRKFEIDPFTLSVPLAPVPRARSFRLPFGVELFANNV